MSLRQYLRFSVRGLLHATTAVAVFLAFFRLSGVEAGLFAVAAGYLVIGLCQQARDIWRAMWHSAAEPALRRSRWWSVTWRYLLAATVATIFIWRFVCRAAFGPSYESDVHYYANVWALTCSLLQTSLIIANNPGPRQTGEVRNPLRWAVVADALGLILAALWLAMLLSDLVLVGVLVQFSIRGVENSLGVAFAGHRLNPTLWPDTTFFSVFITMAISSLASCIGLVSVRWLAKKWECGWRWRFAPLAVFLAVVAWQVERLWWALGTAAPQMSPYIWEMRPQRLSANFVLGGLLQVIFITAWAARWTLHSQVATDTVLSWRRPGHYYPHEWALLLLLLPGYALYTLVKDLISDLISWHLLILGYLLHPTFLLNLALAITALMQLVRWLRGGEISDGTEIRELNVAKGLTIWACLLITVVLPLPAFGLTAFSGWIVLGGLPTTAEPK